MPEEEVRAIFQRLNRYTAVLNSQELRHATYWGPFIKLMEEVSDYEFWSNAGIFSANDRRRMLDVEFISELAVAVLNGMQNKKKNLEEFYQQYETNFEDEEKLRGVFIRVLGEIEQVLPALNKMRWRKKSDFYTLFVQFAAHVGVLPLSEEKRLQTRDILTTFATAVDIVIREEVPGEVYDTDVGNYVRYVERAASDLGSRRVRAEMVEARLASVFGA